MRAKKPLESTESYRKARDYQLIFNVVFTLLFIIALVLAIFKPWQKNEISPVKPEDSCRSGLREDCPPADTRYDNLPETPNEDAPWGL